MTTEEQRLIQVGSWIEHEVEDSNLIDQILLSHCICIDGKIVVKPEDEWAENIGTGG